MCGGRCLTCGAPPQNSLCVGNTGIWSRIFSSLPPPNSQCSASSYKALISLRFLSRSLHAQMAACTFVYYIPPRHKILIKLSKHPNKIIFMSIFGKCYELKMFSDCMAPSSLSSLVAFLNLTKRCFHSSRSPGLSKEKFFGGLNFVITPFSLLTPCESMQMRLLSLLSLFIGSPCVSLCVPRTSV